MKQFIQSLWSQRPWRICIAVFIPCLAAALILTVILLLLPPATEEVGQSPTEDTQSVTAQGEEPLPTVPQTAETAEPPETGKKEPSKTVLAHGIDVSKWQGRIDWAKVQADGVEFAMIRLGFADDDGCGEDPNAYYNLQEAEKYGVPVGVYFYSEAESPAAARAEAQWVLERIGGYAISLPVVLDWESPGKDLTISAAVRTDTALSFLREVSRAGYDAMLYAPISELEDENMWQADRIVAEFHLWGAAYTAPVYPDVSFPSTDLPLSMWQYSDKGKVKGISGNVDRNVSYVLWEKKEPKDPTARPKDPSAPDGFKQVFATVSKSVTAKIEVNLRALPSMDGEVVGKLSRGTFLTCTGESDMGWSRLLLNGQPVYAVTSYLTEQLQEEPHDPAAGHSFEKTSELVTAKVEVNLRAAPTTDSEVVVLLKNGEYVERIGIGDRGWDKLLYQGREVFAVASYLEVKR
ncbi:MAG: hypothetical protein IJC84_05360 [Clostridia bacterium]|nr:hypothetical protein [Clostridia bacterium]